MRNDVTEFSALINSAFAENGFEYQEATIVKLSHYLSAMQTWNRVYNLTSITDAREMVYLHIVDSLLISQHLSGQRFLDIGTGAGLPGIPLAIANPHQQWTLLDKNNKKIRFLIQVIAELGLKNVTAVHSRVEDFPPTNQFDYILSRAYGSLSLFCESAAHLLNADGILIAMKGKYPSEELTQLPGTFHTATITSLIMKGMQVERHLIHLKRI